jgi:large subunit ribosomal protein L1
MAEQKLPRLSKRMKVVRGKIDRSKAYAVDEALKLVKESAVAKFDESVDIAVNLGIDAKKSDQTVRGSVVLPAGIGRESARRGVHAGRQGGCAGGQHRHRRLRRPRRGSGRIHGLRYGDATPDAMKVVGQLGQILGPRGLMPNPKVKVSPDVVTAVKKAKAGQVQYRTDKAGIVQCTIGRASFTADQLKTNLMALIEALNKARPQGVKGVYLKKISVSSTMGAGVRVDTTGLAQHAPAH